MLFREDEKYGVSKRKKFNVYAETKEQCEIKLAEMIAEKKAEIAVEKAGLTNNPGF